jgi:hypothetical protein
VVFPLRFPFYLLLRVGLRSDLILEARVVGFIFNSSAAPQGPKILPPDAFKAATIFSRSNALIASSVITAERLSLLPHNRISEATSA